MLTPPRHREPTLVLSRRRVEVNPQRATCLDILISSAGIKPLPHINLVLGNSSLTHLYIYNRTFVSVLCVRLVYVCKVPATHGIYL